MRRVSVFHGLGLACAALLVLSATAQDVPEPTLTIPPPY